MSEVEVYFSGHTEDPGGLRKAAVVFAEANSLAVSIEFIEEAVSPYIPTQAVLDFIRDQEDVIDRIGTQIVSRLKEHGQKKSVKERFSDRFNLPESQPPFLPLDDARTQIHRSFIDFCIDDRELQSANGLGKKAQGVLTRLSVLLDESSIETPSQE